MVIENERDDPEEEEAELYRQGPLAEPDHDVPSSWATFLAMRQEIRLHQYLSLYCCFAVSNDQVSPSIDVSLICSTGRKT